jgi:hypothetical protein
MGDSERTRPFPERGQIAEMVVGVSLRPLTELHISTEYGRSGFNRSPTETHLISTKSGPRGS